MHFKPISADSLSQQKHAQNKQFSVRQLAVTQLNKYIQFRILLKTRNEDKLIQNTFLEK